VAKRPNAAVTIVKPARADTESKVAEIVSYVGSIARGTCTNSKICRPGLTRSG
jgi:hypothetical protein